MSPNNALHSDGPRVARPAGERGRYYGSLQLTERPGLHRELDDPPTPEEEAVYRAAQTELCRLQELTPSPPGLAAGYKFCSNAGWLVSPEECNAIANGLSRALSEDAAMMYPFADGQGPPLQAFLDTLSAWATYNAVAAAHGGYRVR